MQVQLRDCGKEMQKKADKRNKKIHKIGKVAVVLLVLLIDIESSPS